MGRTTYIDQMREINMVPTVNTILTEENTRRNAVNNHDDNMSYDNLTRAHKKAEKDTKRFIGTNIEYAKRELKIHNELFGTHYYIHVAKRGDESFPTTWIYDTNRIKVDLDRNGKILSISVG